ncbi:uncharacterized protein TRIVIDRAFT_62694 [Trichoderma virens Gv29-8]|uniref:Uncharacterized protein n=1 Tax=Hypocrea virens (strain Gv29-8 / FGSC 10586) TaxID=413071 RepID=G9MES5_HYPVG|nr:uncharacterized protein TRIVIDRAFT_62694 [Trichoderma virens Gv29-8]EHK26893.1 hypothetical protein TRIVIDRAFT_62694 [Trichoderma virens Gv29-8]UKZ57346.1 hypothetical protein TrVGV298_011199 [Trichoderma virens]
MENPETPQLVSKSEGKVRVLLESVTHLVPGSDRDEKLSFVKNIVCQRHWKRDFDRSQERMYPYGDFFGLKNRNCFFLIDHHGHDHTVQEEEVPVIWYKWTGESLIHMNDTLPLWIQEELKKWPFTWEGRTVHRLPRGPDGNFEPKVQREVIKSKLNLGIPMFARDIEFLREHPEHALWLKARLDRELWAQIEPFCELPEEVK